MILGAPDIRRFQLMETVKWSDSSPSKPLLGKHPLGTIYWGMKLDEENHQNVCAVHPHQKEHYTQQLLDMVVSEHGISEKEGLEYLPLLVHDLSRYHQDHSVLEPNYEELVMSKDDEQVLSFYTENITEVYDKKGNRRLQLPLPWKEGYPMAMPHSFEIARRRLNAQAKRMSAQPERKQKYMDTFTAMKEQGHAELVEERSAGQKTQGLIHYITHFATEQEKFRVVYNGALRIHGISINDMLHRGPMFLEPLVGVLVRFRQHPFAISCDIKNMFFQIALHPKDRDMLRFIPFTGNVFSENTREWRFTVMPYGLICIPSIAGFCLKYTARKNYANVSADTVQRVESDFYVDDLITSVETLKEACRVVKEAKLMLATTGFELTKFSSNSRQVLANISSEELAPRLKSLDLAKDGLPKQKTLGITWDSERDILELRGKQHGSIYDPLTRRSALSTLNSYFDPLGLWCPFFVKLKCCYSEIVVSTEGWDDEVCQDLQQEWNAILSELEGITSLAVPRQYLSLTSGEIELHMFSDASQLAMGACVYLRKIQGARIDLTLVLGKSRIFPRTQIEKFSIARKELVALSMGTDLLKQCKHYLTVPISRTYLWVDSATVIKWCKCTSKQLTQFVRNRVDRILTSSSGQTPEYVDTKNNPADVASRGMRLNQTREYELWTNGPEFLRRPTESWNVGLEKQASFTNQTEWKTELVSPLTHLNFIQLKEENRILKGLSTSQSSMEAEQLLLLVQKCFFVLSCLRGNNSGDGKLSNSSLTQARMCLLSMAQNETMGNIIAKMRNRPCTFEEAVLKGPIDARKHYLVQMFKFIPFLDENGLLRIGGRLQNSELLYNFQHPIILPYRHWTTELYVKRRHAISSHLGADYVFGSLQVDDGLWPIGGVVTVRHYVKDCLGCKIRKQTRGKQLMAPLPSVRLKPKCHVFTYVASDLAGPFLVAIGRATVKRWLCVFVCMVTTAVRIEIAADLTASAFINVFRRFLCSTGYKTRFMRTDNGTNFVGANNIMKKKVKAALKAISTASEFKAKMREWVRQALNALSGLSIRNPTDDEFNTCSKMAEYVINCRPLTKLVSDDGLPPLRPIDLMVGALEPRDNCSYPSISSPNDELRRGYRYTQRIVQLWWDRWYKLYLSTLQKRQKWREKVRDFKIGDLVIVHNEPPPRFLKYPYAVITEVKKGTDGHVRSVTLRISNGGRKERDITRLTLINAVDDE